MIRRRPTAAEPPRAAWRLIAHLQPAPVLDTAAEIDSGGINAMRRPGRSVIVWGRRLVARQSWGVSENKRLGLIVQSRNISTS